jgi:hypothetical protein
MSLFPNDVFVRIKSFRSAMTQTRASSCFGLGSNPKTATTSSLILFSFVSLVCALSNWSAAFGHSRRLTNLHRSVKFRSTGQAAIPCPAHANVLMFLLLWLVFVEPRRALASRRRRHGAGSTLRLRLAFELGPLIYGTRLRSADKLK